MDSRVAWTSFGYRNIRLGIENMLKYLVPKFPLADLPPMLAVAMLGAILASVYGVLHDQWTYSISPEYFTKLKFPQFAHANLGLGDRFFVATIGILATWWVGLLAAWLLARRLIPHQPRCQAYRQIRRGFAVIFAFSVAFALLGYVYGLWRGPEADYTAWTWAARSLQITDLWSFVRVAYIHNASYLGSLTGLIVAMLILRPRGTKPATLQEDDTNAGSIR